MADRLHPRLIAGHYHVRMTDGTTWALDGEDDKSFNWILRYGREEDIIKARLTIASIVDSYMALLGKPEKRRNEIVRALREAMDLRAAAQHKGDDRPEGAKDR